MIRNPLVALTYGMVHNQQIHLSGKLEKCERCDLAEIWAKARLLKDATAYSLRTLLGLDLSSSIQIPALVTKYWFLVVNYDIKVKRSQLERKI